MQPSDAERNWNELTRRMAALPGEPISTDSSVVSRDVPVGDPTGFVELAETMNREHRGEGTRLAQEFPFFESFFSPLLPWHTGAAAAYQEVDRLIRSGLGYVGNLQRGVEYEMFCDAGGEVTTFHFKSAAARASFREALGLDCERGFDAVVDQFKLGHS